MEVYIDGTLADTINQYSAALTWQRQWDSDELTDGIHEVRLVHASGLINDLDAIIVTDSTATATPTDTITGTVKKFYTMGSTTIAVRTVSGTGDVLNWVLGDHCGASPKQSKGGQVQRLSPPPARGAREASPQGYDPNIRHFNVKITN